MIKLLLFRVWPEFKLLKVTVMVLKTWRYAVAGRLWHTNHPAIPAEHLARNNHDGFWATALHVRLNRRYLLEATYATVEQLFMRQVIANSKKDCSPKNWLSLVSLILAAAEPLELRLPVSPSLVFSDLLELWNYGRTDMMPDVY
jgi:hypothetical protein